MEPVDKKLMEAAQRKMKGAIAGSPAAGMTVRVEVCLPGHKGYEHDEEEMDADEEEDSGIFEGASEGSSEHEIHLPGHDEAKAKKKAAGYA